jgi:hypothetical protein
VRLTSGAWPAGGTPASGGTGSGATRCKRVRRAVVMRVARHLRHAKAVVNGRHVKVQRLAHHRVRLTLRHVRKGTALVKVTGRVGYGRWMRKTHRYRMCLARSRSARNVGPSAS